MLNIIQVYILHNICSMLNLPNLLYWLTYQKAVTAATSCLRLWKRLCSSKLNRYSGKHCQSKIIMFYSMAVQIVRDP